jgi:heme exporter protein A
LSAPLSFKDVTVRRGGRVLVQGLSLEIGPSGAVLLTGANGVGKSSLIRVAAGLLAPAEGTVTRSAAALSDDQLALDERLDLADALGFWTRLGGKEPQRGMDAMGIAHLARIPVRMLSTGQRKRASLARVISSGVPLWLLDEPGNGLDAEGLERLTAAIADHRLDGGALLVATHQPLAIEQAGELVL